MAVTVVDSGSQTATLTTLHTLKAITSTPGVYVLAVDANALSNGETLDLQILANLTTGGTERVLYAVSLSHAQAEPIIQSVPVVCGDDLTFKLRQTGGTGRAFPWAVYSL